MNDAPLGRIFVLDAIDGAGKSTVLANLRNRFEAAGKRVFDLVEYEKTAHQFPTPDQLADADVLIVAEPSYCSVGAHIREHLIKAGSTPDPREVAEAFAADRAELYGTILLPWLASHPTGIILQDRGVITSLAYQPLTSETITTEWLLALPGNQVELSRTPNAILLLELDPDVARARLAGRNDPSQQQIYDRDDFQRTLAHRYRDEQVLAPFRATGTQIVFIDATQGPEEVTEDCWRAIRPHLP